MVRLRRIEQADRIFFVTTNLARGLDPLTPHERDLVLETLATDREQGSFFLFGYVIMPNHLHLLVSPHGHPLTRILRDLKSVTGFEIARQRKARGPIWQPRYFDNIIRQVKHFWEKLEYIHENPVKAGLAGDPAGWRWSSYNHYANRGSPPVPLDPIDLPADGDALLWPAPWS